MFVYEVLLATGAVGLLVMTLIGFGHFGGVHGGGHGNAVGHGHTGGHLSAGAHGGHAPVVAGGHAGHAAGGHGHGSHVSGTREGAGATLFTLLSPLTLFAACLGAGAVGILLTRWHLAPLWIAACAVIAGVGFNALLVRPLMRLVMGFASLPARGLDGALMQRAEAVTGFNAEGEGLVRVLVDGQTVDVLARLTDEERRQGARVVRGQFVLVEDVDGHRNRCTVSRL